MYLTINIAAVIRSKKITVVVFLKKYLKLLVITRLKQPIMSEETSKDSNLKTGLGAVSDILKEIPVYQDVVQPSAKQIGSALATITKTVNIALAPIKVLVWGYEQIES